MDDIVDENISDEELDLDDLLEDDNFIQVNKSIGNIKGILIRKEKRTLPFLNSFEKTRLINDEANLIETSGYMPLDSSEIKDYGSTNSLKIAKQAYTLGKLTNFTIVRYVGYIYINGGKYIICEFINPSQQTQQ